MFPAYSGIQDQVKDPGLEPDVPPRGGRQKGTF